MEKDTEKDEIDKIESPDEAFGDDDLDDDEDSYELDDNGDLIEPDADDDRDDEGKEDDGDESDDESAADDTDKTTETPDEEPATEKTDDEHTKALAEKDKQIEEAQAKYAKLERQTRESLEKLGVKIGDDGNVLAALEKVAAEADDIPVDEYRQKRDAAEKAEQAQRALQAIEFEKMAKADLEELHKYFPETRKYTKITDVPNVSEFGAFRDKGLSAVQAYAAANPTEIRISAAAAGKQQQQSNTKGHLQSVVPPTSRDTSIKIPKSELRELRDLFPNKTDKEIAELYKRTK